MTVITINGKPVLLGDLNYKMAVVVRKDLDMRPGKIAAQASHAAIFNDREATADMKDKWEKSGERLVVLKVQSLDELMAVKAKADAAGVYCGVQTDAGLTDVEAGTVTCIAIGPDAPEKIDAITGHLKLLG